MSVNIKDLTAEEQDRLIGLEARMRGVTKIEMTEQFKHLIDSESPSQKQLFQSINPNSSDVVEQALFPSINGSGSNSNNCQEDLEKSGQKQGDNNLKRKRADSQRREIEITPKKKIQIQRTNEQPANKKITEFFDNDQKTKPKRNSDKKKKQKLSEDINQVNGLDRDDQIQKMIDNLQMANKNVVEKEILLKERFNTIDLLQIDNKQLRDSDKDLKHQLQVLSDRLLKAVETVKKLVLDNDRFRRLEIQNKMVSQKHSLGEFSIVREGTKLGEQWIDGHDIKDAKNKKLLYEAQKEDLDRKKKIKLKKDDDDLFKASIELKIAMIKKEEENLDREIEKLEIEKIIFIKQLKRQYLEDHSRFGKPNSQGSVSWPVIGERYQLLGLLGQGGFSEVYKAYDLQEMREVACKIHQLNSAWSEASKENYIKHALRENSVHRQLSHPHIVKLFDSVEMDQDSFCTVLEFCDGPDLSFYLKKNRTINEKEAKFILMQILAAIKYLNTHKNKIIHYDLKPQNILLHQGAVKISDFGLCKVLENEDTRLELTSQGVGTYWYLPPECFQTGEHAPAISSKVDIWSLGVIYFEMIFGFKPFGQGLSQITILKEQTIINAKLSFPLKPQIGQECKDFIKGCLNVSQIDRLDVIGAIQHPYFSRKA